MRHAQHRACGSCQPCGRTERAHRALQNRRRFRTAPTRRIIRSLSHEPTKTRTLRIVGQRPTDSAEEALGEAIAKLEDLDAKRMLPPEAKDMLAAAYLSEAQAHVGPRVVVVGSAWQKEVVQWQKEVDRALTLSPDLREQWVRFLLERAERSYQPSYPEIEGTRWWIQTAGEYADGHPDLEEMMRRARAAVAEGYLTLARDMRDNRPQKGYLVTAIELNGDEARRTAYDILRSGLSDAAAKRASLSTLYGFLEVMDELRLRIPPQDVPVFLKFGDATPPAILFPGLPDAWKKMVEKLAAGVP